MPNFTKLFNTQIHKEIFVTKSEFGDRYKVRMSFKVSNSITLFEGECKVFQINYESGHKSLDTLVFFVELSPDQIRILIKGSCQIRTFVENDEIQKLVLEKLGTLYYKLGAIDNE